MPSYTFARRGEDDDNGDPITFNRIMSIADREQFLKDNPDVYQVVQPLGRRDNFISGTGLKTDEGFRDVLRNIKSVTPGNNIEIW